MLIMIANIIHDYYTLLSYIITIIIIIIIIIICVSSVSIMIILIMCDKYCIYIERERCVNI